jgi:exopolysaccharide biosynthesis predicted pyruvyltransferase EpsI
VSLADVVFSNKGDSAIWSGESLLLKALNIETVYVCSSLRRDYNATLLRNALVKHGGPSKTAILDHGGGNFGDLYYIAQELREAVVSDFPDYRIRAFPQTYKFKDQEKLEKTRRIFGQHPDLQLTARDTRSFEQMQRAFGSKHHISLLPDLATMLYTSPLIPQNQTDSTTHDFVFLARVDKEGGQNHWKEKATIQDLGRATDSVGELRETTFKIMDWLKEEPVGLQAALEDCLSNKREWDKFAWLNVQWTYEFLSQKALIISDRLHVHILSTIWNIEHVIVEEGAYAKLRGYHESWLSECDDKVAFTLSVREGVDAAKAWYQKGGFLH